MAHECRAVRRTKAMARAKKVPTIKKKETTPKTLDFSVSTESPSPDKMKSRPADKPMQNLPSRIHRQQRPRAQTISIFRIATKKLGKHNWQAIGMDERGPSVCFIVDCMEPDAMGGPKKP